MARRSRPRHAEQKPKKRKRPRGWHRGPRQDVLYRDAMRRLGQAA